MFLKKEMDINTIGTALSVADAAAIVILYLHLNKRLSVLEDGSGTGNVKASGAARPESLESKVATLQNEISVLLQRLQMYDELFLKIMNRMKEINPVVDRYLEGVPLSIKETDADLSVKKTAIRRRSDSSLMARKELFVDADSEEKVVTENRTTGRGVAIEDSDLEDDSFSFLKD